MSQVRWVNHWFYINVASRTDRRTEMEAELRRVGLQAERFEAYVPKDGEQNFYACAVSHFKLLELAIERKLPCYGTMEDDANAIDNVQRFHQNLERFYDLHGTDFDVCMLCASPAELQESATGVPDDVCKVAKNANGGCGYIVHERFYSALKSCWEASLPKLKSTNQHWLYMNDMAWKPLQHTSKWFVMSPQLVYPRESFSNLAGCRTNHHNVLPRGVYDITLVTAYIPFGDLEPGTAHPSSHYLSAAREMFDTPLPLVAFLHASCADALEDQRRRRGLADRTRIIRITPSDLPLMTYHYALTKQRELFWPTRDSRNSASVHLMTLSKAHFMRQAMEMDPFETSAYAWIDFGAARSAFDSQTFDHALVLDRLKKGNVSLEHVTALAVNAIDTALLDRVCEATEDDVWLSKFTCTCPALREYYREYRYAIAGTFLTMGKEIGRKYCDEMLRVSERHLKLIGGHGEEMCIAVVYHRHPAWFKLSAGDYKQCVLNYGIPVHNTYAIAHNVLKRFLETGHAAEARLLARQLVLQHRTGVMSMPMPSWLSDPIRHALTPAKEDLEERLVAWTSGSDAADWDRVVGSSNRLAAQWACEWSPQPVNASMTDRAIRLCPFVRKLPDFASRRISVKVDAGFVEMNASILPLDNEFVLAVRTRKYENGRGESRTRLLRLSTNLDIVADEPVQERVPEGHVYVGLEDPRLFQVDSHRVWLTAVSLETTGGVVARTAVCTIERIDGAWSVTHVRSMQPIRPVEKNWLAFCAPGPGLSSACVKFVYAIDPVTHMAVTGTVDPSTHPCALRFHDDDEVQRLQKQKQMELKWKGSACPVWVGALRAWLCAVHINDADPTRGDRRFFATRFVLLEADGVNLRAYSEWFYVHHANLEYVSGLCLFGDRVFLAFSVRDCETHVGSLPLTSLAHLAWFSPSSTNGAQLMRLPVQTVFTRPRMCPSIRSYNNLNFQLSSSSSSSSLSPSSKSGRWFLHVTHYKERLEWLQRVPQSCAQIIVVHRGPSDMQASHYGVPAHRNIDWRVQPNQGREGRSVFEYALELLQSGSNKEKGDTIVFSQSDPDSHVPWMHKVEDFEAYAKDPHPFSIACDPGLYTDAGHLQQHHKYAQALESKTMQPLPLTFAQFYESVMGRHYPRGGIRVSWCNAFAVTVERLTAHAPSFYHRVLDTLSVPDPEAGHAIERLMRSIFDGRSSEFTKLW